MSDKIENLREMAAALLASDSSNDEARKKWGENVRDLLQELRIYHFELEHQNAALSQSERELAESREKYIDLFEDAPVGYVVIDAGGAIKQANRLFTELFVPAYPPNAVVTGRNFLEFVCPEYRAAFRRFAEMLLNPGSVLPLELKLIDSNGSPRFVSITAGRRKAGDSMFRLAVNDVNTKKKLELQLLEAQEHTAAVDNKKTLFLAHINHEIRTPLASITGLCDILSEPSLSTETQQKYLASLKDAVVSMKKVSDEIMDLALLNKGSGTIQCSPVDVGKICRDHAALAQKLVQDKGIHVVCEQLEMPILLGDGARIETVIHSVLRHASENVIEGEIRIRGHHEQCRDGSGILFLEFSGRGIGAENSMPGEAAAQDCSGVELFVVRQMLNFLKGRLTISPSRDAVRVEIPLLKAPSAPAVQRRAVENPSEQWPKTCLIVDDVMLNLKVLAALMRKFGCVSIMASSGKEALQSLARNRVDLILSDLWMPEMNGMEFAMNVRQIPDYDDIPIVAVTADVERTQNFDMRYFAETMIKPVDLAVLKETLLSLRRNKLTHF